jgi:hypothetical protein
MEETRRSASSLAYVWDTTTTMKVNELEVPRPAPETVIQYRLGRVVGVV